jgi:hypothetical protein
VMVSYRRARKSLSHSGFRLKGMACMRSSCRQAVEGWRWVGRWVVRGASFSSISGGKPEEACVCECACPTAGANQGRQAGRQAGRLPAHLRDALDDDQQLLGGQVCTARVQQPLAQHGEDEVQDGRVCGACPHRLPGDEHDQGGKEVLAVVGRQGER